MIHAGKWAAVMIHGSDTELFQCWEGEWTTNVVMHDDREGKCWLKSDTTSTVIKAYFHMMVNATLK